MTTALPAATREATEATAPAPAAAPAVAVEAPRDLATRTLDDRAALVGSLLGSLALVWVVYRNLLPTEGRLGFAVSWFLAFLLLYGLVTVVRHPRTLVADRLAAALVYTLAGLVGGALLVVVGYTFWRGRDALRHLNFFVEDLSTTGPLDPLTQGGMLHAIVGSLIMIAIAVAITVPLGLACAVFLNEVRGPLSAPVRTIVEAMTALPSIVAGLFVYATVLLALGAERSGLAAALAMSVMMLPIIARSAEVVLRVVPGGLREASLALGVSQWRTVWRVVLPTARPSLATAVILGVARGIGETSPVLLTAGYTTYVNYDPTGSPMVSLPLATFTLARSAEEVDQARAFGAASILFFVVLVLFVVGRVAAQRSREGR